MNRIDYAIRDYKRAMEETGNEVYATNLVMDMYDLTEYELFMVLGAAS